jgi:hypothetical protein
MMSLFKEFASSLEVTGTGQPAVITVRMSHDSKNKLDHTIKQLNAALPGNRRVSMNMFCQCALERLVSETQDELAELPSMISDR